MRIAVSAILMIAAHRKQARRLLSASPTPLGPGGRRSRVARLVHPENLAHPLRRSINLPATRPGHHRCAFRLWRARRPQSIGEALQGFQRCVGGPADTDGLELDAPHAPADPAVARADVHALAVRVRRQEAWHLAEGNQRFLRHIDHATIQNAPAISQGSYISRPPTSIAHACTPRMP